MKSFAYFEDQHISVFLIKKFLYQKKLWQKQIDIFIIKDIANI